MKASFGITTGDPREREEATGGPTMLDSSAVLDKATEQKNSRNG